MNQTQDMDATMADGDDEKTPKIVVTKITPQLLTLWNKELERLHKALVSPGLPDSDREWVKKSIEDLHRLVFGG